MSNHALLNAQRQCYNASMLSRLTDKTFYQYLKCPNWVYFDAHADEPKPHDPLLLKLLEDGLIPEKEREILSDRQDIAEVTAEDLDEAARQTMEFMRDGRQTIYHGVLADGHWVAHPDVLEKVEGESRLGTYYYVAADVKRANRLKDEYTFQGCFYAELLERLQGVKPVQGYVINPERKIFSYLIEQVEAEYHLTLLEIEKILAGKRPVHFVTSGCKQSPWFSECRTESEVCDDLSLLNRVWREEVSRLQQAGIRTMTELATCSVEELVSRVPRANPKRLLMLRDQALAIQKGTHFIRERMNFREAKVELYFDIESDPLRDFDYLFGVLVVTQTDEQYLPFFAESPELESAMWQEFVHFIEQHANCPIYHYGWFESEVVRRFSAKHGISAVAKAALQKNMIDLNAVLRPAVIFPLSFYSLKDIGSYIGFHWRMENASGANCVLWFEKWLKTKEVKWFQKILEYNEDDVRATYRLQRWLREQINL